jgi:N-acetylmuramoyl-L-alanine amidase
VTVERRPRSSESWPHGARVRAWILAALALLVAAALHAAISSSAPAETPPERVFVAGPALRVEARTRTIDGIRFISTTDLAAALGATQKWTPQNLRLQIRFGGPPEHAAEFVIGASTVMIDDAAFNLPAAAVLDGGLAFVPLPGLAEALSGAVPGGARWDEARSTLLLGENDFALTSVEILDRGARTVLRVTAASPPRLDFEGGTFEILFPDVAAAPGFEAPPPSGLVASLGVQETDRGLALEASPAPEVRGYRLEQSDEAWSLILSSDSLDVVSSDYIPIGSSAYDLAGVSADDHFRRYRRVVIDPGHGGAERGAVGELIEEDVVLQIARALQDELEQTYGYEVVLTREGDEALSADRRAEIVNASGADLCVSLHADASFSSRMSGPHVIVFRGGGVTPVFAKDFGARHVEVLPWSGAQARHHAASEILARETASELSETLPDSDVPVLQRPLRTLSSIDMPAVAVECGYVTNRNDAAMLASPDRRADLARAVARGVAAYIRLMRGEREL